VLTGKPVPFASVIVGAVPNTSAPVPVAPVTADSRFALDGVPRNVAIPVPRPDTPVLIGSPVPFGNVIVGAVPNTSDPVPVEVVIAARRFTLDGAARNAAMPVASPVTPVLIGIAGVPVMLALIPPAEGFVTVIEKPEFGTVELRKFGAV
jgi:hypothetical protein